MEIWSDPRKFPADPEERVKKNLEEGRVSNLATVSRIGGFLNLQAQTNVESFT